MDWMFASAMVTLLLVVAPLLIAEVVAYPLTDVDLSQRRRRLWIGTATGIVVGLAWLVADRAAISAGRRSPAVVAASASFFVVSVSLLTWPIIQATREARSRHTGGVPNVRAPRAPAFQVGFDYFVALTVLATSVAVWLSPNDLGYRLKGALTVTAGVVLYALGRPRASWTFIAFVTSLRLADPVPRLAPAMAAPYRPHRPANSRYWRLRMVRSSAPRRTSLDGGSPPGRRELAQWLGQAVDASFGFIDRVPIFLKPRRAERPSGN